MIDIISAEDAKDLGIYDTQTYRAVNILAVQLGDLEYAKDLGIDLRYFLSEDFTFENESFAAYLIEVLANHGINVTSVTETLNSLYNDLNITLSPEQSDSGLIAR